MEIVNRILLVGLSNEFVRFISMRLSGKIGYYYLDVESLLEYSIIDRLKMREICGVKYLEEQEKKIILSLNDYEKTVMSMKLETFMANYNNLKENNLIVYVAIDKKQIGELNNFLKSEYQTETVINELLFNEHDKFLKKNCDFIVNCDINNIDESFSDLISKF